MSRLLMNIGMKLGAAAEPSMPPFFGQARAAAPRAFGFGSHSSDNDPDVLEKEKQKNLKGEQDHTIVEGWNEKLASDSEAAIKADAHVADNHTVEELQEHTKRVVEEMHAHGDPVASATTTLETKVTGHKVPNKD